ncbi:MAG: hypothetical protein LBB53_00990 [Prevotellaceae bacterium]|jgi:hypothetical protein|nr:hypothetical protein [Prevotellaceae bacterium]
MLSVAESGRFCLEGKGVYGFLTVCKGQAASGFEKNLHTCAALRVVFFSKTLTDLNPAPKSPQNIKRPMRRMKHEIKKRSLIMVNSEKILKQKNSLRSEINIRLANYT